MCVFVLHHLASAGRLLRMRDDGGAEAGVRLGGDGHLVFESVQLALRGAAAVSSLHQVGLCRIWVCFHAF